MTKWLTFRRLIRVLACCSALAGCWQDPKAPSDNSTDAYGWTAPLTVAGSASHYRIPVGGGLADWMKAHDVASLAVFDAKDSLQACGTLSGETNHPLATMPQSIAAHIGPFDAAACKKAIPVCFKNRPCTVPDFCSPQTIDLTGTTLDGVARPEEIVDLAAGKVPPLPMCRGYHSEASRDCDENDRQAAEDYRRALNRQTEAAEFIANYGWAPENPGGPSSETLTAKSEADGLLVTFDTAPANAMLSFRWNQPAALGRLGTATLTCLGHGSADARPFDVQGQSGENGTTVQEFWSSCPGPTFRLTVKPAVDRLQLLGVSATAYRPKPYMADDVPQFWFEAKGTPPYAVFLGPQHSGCGTMLNVKEAAALPHAAEPDWPPLANPGSPVVHERSLWVRLITSRSPWLPWVYWLLYVGGACAAALLVALARWAWLAKSAPRP